MDAMLHISTLHYLVLGAALFLLGVIGVLTRRNVVIVLMSIELILNAVNLNLVALSRYWQGINGATALHGQVFAIFVITDAAAEAAVGLGILIAFFRNKETINVDEVNLLKW
jgi:NADH-quinone oxidoreductase subunit K